MSTAPVRDTEAEPRVEPADAIRLVLGVARLGEADLAGWWSSQGLNPAVRFALAGFRRTGRVMGAELALLSATRRHRQILPRPKAVHLFSPHLPYLGWTQAYLAELKSTGPSALIDELSTRVTVEAAVAALQEARPPGDTADVALLDPAFLGFLVGKYLAAAEAGRALSIDDIDHIDLMARS